MENQTIHNSKIVLIIIIVSQFFCTSLWFAGNGVMSGLITSFDLAANVVGHLTSLVQFGFILGTLLFAILSIADRFSPSKVFMLCALLGATFNLGLIWEGNTLFTILCLRFFTGFFLAGIYPVGMKIAADYFDAGLGKSLGYLVGALVLGTALPHLLKDICGTLPWVYVIATISILAVLGGLLMYLLVPDGPHRKTSNKLELSAFATIFKNEKFRHSAFGYFGHMWELYAFWAFVPFILTAFNAANQTKGLNVPLWSFFIIGAGALACFLSGSLTARMDAKRIAIIALSISGLCCLVFPIIFEMNSFSLFIAFLLIWGMSVVADSPMFSTLVAHSATPEIKGTALTIVNCIGYAISVVSIQLINSLVQYTNSKAIFMLLAIGPFLGLISLLKMQSNKNQAS